MHRDAVSITFPYSAVAKDYEHLYVLKQNYRQNLPKERLKTQATLKLESLTSSASNAPHKYTQVGGVAQYLLHVCYDLYITGV